MMTTLREFLLGAAILGCGLAAVAALTALGWWVMPAVCFVVLAWHIGHIALHEWQAARASDSGETETR